MAPIVTNNTYKNTHTHTHNIEVAQKDYEESRAFFLKWAAGKWPDAVHMNIESETQVKTCHTYFHTNPQLDYI